MGLAWNICAPLGTLSTFFFNPVFQVSTAKNEINLFNNHVLIVPPVTFSKCFSASLGIRNNKSRLYLSLTHQLFGISRVSDLKTYSRSSIARTPVYHGSFELVFESLRKSSDSSRKQIQSTLVISNSKGLTETYQS